MPNDPETPSPASRAAEAPATTLPPHLVCYYCKLAHRKVEAGGVYHCPNPLCTGPGAQTFRRKLASFRVVDGDYHTVDDAEMIAFGLEYASKLDDAPLAAHIRASVSKWQDVSEVSHGR